MSKLVASRGLIGPAISVRRVTAQKIPAVVSELFGDLPGLPLPQAFISTSSCEQPGSSRRSRRVLADRAGRIVMRYRQGPFEDGPCLYQWAAVCCGQNL